MAFHRSLIFQIFTRINRSTIHLQKNLKQSTPSKNCSTVDFEDAMDNFTIELLQKKKESWDIKKEKFKSIKSSLQKNGKNCKLDIENLSELQLDEKFNLALVECNDEAVIALIRECSRLEKCPSHDLILQVLDVCAQNGEIELINNLEELCTSKKIALPSNFIFDIYKAHAIWSKGLVRKGLDMFHEIYITNPFLRRYIRITLRQLIQREVKSNSEAVLIYMLKIAKNISECYKDYYFLICIWETCFMSELYSDQQFALNLLYEDKKLSEVVTSRLPFMMSALLKNHKTDSVYKLLECFHNLKMNEQCTIVAMAFLDYHFFRHNLRNYSEIIKWCKESNIPLPNVYNERFLNLLLKIDSHSNAENKSETKEKKRPPDFKF